MIVKLEGHADHLGAATRSQRRYHRAVDAARHGNDDARLAGGPAELEIHRNHRR
jgi:hypothetical protein